MRIYQLQETFGIDQLRIVQQETPRPAAGQVLVRMSAWSLNYRDLLVLRGHYQPDLPLPFTPFSDGVGEVVEVGANVQRVKVGDRVAGIFMQSWLNGPLDRDKAQSALGGALPGVLAEYVVFDAEGVVPVPQHLTDEQAATLPCAAVTAWHALVTAGNLQPGDTVLTQGTGGVSLFALQFALLRGAKVICTSSSNEKLARLQELGASEIINYREEPNWSRRVLDLTGGQGVDHVVEVGGVGTLPESIQAVRMSGRISLIGVLTGMGTFDPLLVLMKSICLQGIYVGSREMFLAMNEAIAQAKLLPVIDKVFGFNEVADALRYQESGAHLGKIVVKV